MGGIFITQQPGSIPQEILSQADNFFTFHLLSKNDLRQLKNANAHYSEDILTQILSEPTKGKAYMWTSNQPFVLPVKIENFEDMAGPNKGGKIQQESPILSKILNEISKDDKTYQSILDKCQKVITEISEENKQTVAIFKQLNDEEKQYCKERGFIAVNKSTGEEFAIDWKFLRELKEHLPDEKENAEESKTDTKSKNQAIDEFI